MAQVSAPLQAYLTFHLLYFLFLFHVAAQILAPPPPRNTPATNIKFRNFFNVLISGIPNGSWRRYLRRYMVIYFFVFVFYFLFSCSGADSCATTPKEYPSNQHQILQFFNVLISGIPQGSWRRHLRRYMVIILLIFT